MKFNIFIQKETCFHSIAYELSKVPSYKGALVYTIFTIIITFI